MAGRGSLGSTLKRVQNGSWRGLRLTRSRAGSGLLRIFLRHFRPLDLMAALEPAPELRKDILVAAGLHEKIARRKSPESAAEDLRIALDEGITTASDVLGLLKPDDRVRYLNRAKLFAFAVEDGFYSGQKNGAEHEKSVDRLLFIIESAIPRRSSSPSRISPRASESKPSCTGCP